MRKFREVLLTERKPELNKWVPTIDINGDISIYRMVEVPEESKEALKDTFPDGLMWNMRDAGGNNSPNNNLKMVSWLEEYDEVKERETLLMRIYNIDAELKVKYLNDAMIKACYNVKLMQDVDRMNELNRVTEAFMLDLHPCFMSALITDDVTEAKIGKFLTMINDVHRDSLIIETFILAQPMILPLAILGPQKRCLLLFYGYSIMTNKELMEKSLFFSREDELPRIKIEDDCSITQL